MNSLTTQISHAVDVAVEQGNPRPRLVFPPIRVFWFSGNAWCEGFTTYTFDEILVRLTIPTKTVADSFKCRRKLDQDITQEALERYRQHPNFDVGKLPHYARICYVETVIKPYLEILL